MENIDAEPPEAPQEAPREAPQEAPLEAPQEAPPVLERQVAFETTNGEVSFQAAPKKRGRPKGAAKPKARPKAAPVEEPVYEAPPPPVDVNALLAPLLQAYMLNSHVAQRQAKAQRNRELAQSMFSRARQRFA